MTYKHKILGMVALSLLPLSLQTLLHILIHNLIHKP